jgi:hypothetical protein
MVERSKPDFGMLEWTDASLDDMFVNTDRCASSATLL